MDNTLKPIKNKTDLAYELYYYPNHDVPYFVSDYIGQHDYKYLPDTTKKYKNIVLNDGTVIEGFSKSYSEWFVIIFVLLILFLLFSK